LNSILKSIHDSYNSELYFKLFEKGVEGIEKGLIFAQESESVTGGELAEGRKCIPRDIKPAWQKVIDICFSGESCSMVHYVLKTCAPFNSEKEGSLLGDMYFDQFVLLDKESSKIEKYRKMVKLKTPLNSLIISALGDEGEIELLRRNEIKQELM